MLLFTLFLLLTEVRAASPEAQALHDFLVGEEIKYAEPVNMTFELLRMSRARQAEVASELITMIPSHQRNKMLVMGMTLVKAIVAEFGKTARELRRDAERLGDGNQAPNSLKLITAQNQAVSALGLPSVAWVLRSENRDYRLRWNLAVEQLLRQDSVNRGGVLEGARFQEWRAGWQDRLRRGIVELGLETLRLAIKHGLYDDHKFKPILVAPGGPAVGPELTEQDLVEGQLLFVTDWPPTDEGDAVEWVLRRPSGEQFAIYSPLGSPFSLEPGRFQPFGMVTLHDLQGFADRIVRAQCFDEALELIKVIGALPPRLSPADLNLHLGRKLRKLEDALPTREAVRNQLDETMYADKGEIPLRRLISDLRSFRALRREFEAQWIYRHTQAIMAGLPRFSLHGLVREATEVAPELGPEPSDDMDHQRSLYQTRTAFEVRGEVEDDSFHLHGFHRGNKDEWSEVAPSGRPHAFELRPLEPTEVERNYAEIPSALHHELTALEVSTSDDRRLTAPRDYQLVRHRVTGSYGLRFKSSSVASVFIRVKFRPEANPERDVPLRDDAVPRLARALRGGGETSLAGALDPEARLTARDLNQLLRAHTLYSFSTQLHDDDGSGPLSEFTKFLDPRGRYCMQCGQAAHLLKRLLDLSLPPGFSARVETVLLRGGTSLARPSHAVVDVYDGARLILRLNPVPPRRDPRAPTVEVARKLKTVEDDKLAARDLDQDLTRLSLNFGDLSRLPEESPLRRAYLLAREVRATLLNPPVDREAIKARVDEELSAISAELTTWTTGVAQPLPREQKIMETHLRAEGVLESLAEKLRRISRGNTEDDDGCGAILARSNPP